MTVKNVKAFRSVISGNERQVMDFANQKAKRSAPVEDTFEMASNTNSLQSIEKGRNVAPSASVMPPLARLFRKS